MRATDFPARTIRVVRILQSGNPVPESALRTGITPGFISNLVFSRSEAPVRQSPKDNACRKPETPPADLRILQPF
jgi:hypothetical protein